MASMYVVYWRTQLLHMCYLKTQLLHVLEHRAATQCTGKRSYSNSAKDMQYMLTNSSTVLINLILMCSNRTNTQHIHTGEQYEEPGTYKHITSRTIHIYIYIYICGYDDEYVHIGIYTHTYTYIAAARSPYGNALATVSAAKHLHAVSSRRHYLLYTTQHIVYSTQYIVYGIYYILCATIHYMIYTISYYIVYSIWHIVYSIYCICRIYYILYTIYYILYTIYYILYTIYYMYLRPPRGAAVDRKAARERGSLLQYRTVWCSIVKYSVTCYSIVQYITVQHVIVQYSKRRRAKGAGVRLHVLGLFEGPPYQDPLTSDYFIRCFTHSQLLFLSRGPLLRGSLKDPMKKAPASGFMGTATLGKSQDVGFVVTFVFLQEVWSRSDMNGMTFEKCYGQSPY